MQGAHRRRDHPDSRAWAVFPHRDRARTMKKLAVPPEADKMRLDLFLAGALKCARTKAQAHVKAGLVRRAGAAMKPHAPVHAGDVLEIDPVAKAPASRAKLPELDILFEDDSLLVVNKPAGLLVHEAHPGDLSPTLADAAAKHAPKIRKVGEAGRHGIVHRLDKDVSGVIAIPKTQEMFEFLKAAFTNRELGKEYVALVYGKLPKDHDRITFKIARSKSKGRMVARPESQEGKDAVTEYEVIARYKTVTLVKVTIETGRTHQIRTHFRAIDHPVVGDTLYFKKRMKNIRPIEMDRLFLHARRLEIPLPDGTRKAFKAPLPAELEAVLKTLPTV
ncbi:RluA family pseudouridine synthase [Patescibacteria group bacterium]|nr:MAG: RluA family pseudouridine synthase [Patescibacteria group bacterium]